LKTSLVREQLVILRAELAWVEATIRSNELAAALRLSSVDVIRWQLRRSRILRLRDLLDVLARDELLWRAVNDPVTSIVVGDGTHGDTPPENLDDLGPLHAA
jgi:hypothetical protein